MKNALRSTLLSSALALTVLHPWAATAGTAPDPAYLLDLGGQRFDPLVQAPRSAGTMSAGPAMRLVQFDGPIRREWLDALTGLGIQPLQYIHPYSYVVWSDEQALSRSAALAGVRWQGDFLPEYKIPPAQRSLDGARREVMLLLSRYADESGLQRAVEGLGGVFRTTTPVNRHLAVAQVELGGDRLFDLAQLPAVYAVQQIVPGTVQEMLRGEMSSQAVVGAYGGAPGYSIVPGFIDWLTDTGYDGTGVIAGIVDDGIFTTHNDLSTQMSPCNAGGGAQTSCGGGHSDHGTHVAAAVAGSGASGVLGNGFLRGLGVAPGAKVISQRYGPFLGAGSGGMVANGMLTIFRESALSNAVITNNSWGPTGSPQGYDIPTQQIDIIARDALPEAAGQQPVIPIWSIMNGGGDGNGACAPSSLGSPDEAKNLFAVGSTALQSGSGAQQSGIFNVSSNSAHGNACDGRRIPHIVAPGCSTDSATNSGANAFTLMCGTSMASPVVTGAASLFIEKYREQNAGATPSPALVKAAFTAVATNLQGFRNADNGVMGHRPDRFQGYGRLDLDAVMNPSVPVMLIDQTEVFTATGQSFSLPIAAAQPDQPMHIMLAWSDAPGHGLGGTTPAWVNNLDLSVAAAGETYLGNVVGADGWSASGGTADPRNNLEGVFLNPSQHGGFVTLTIEASNIAADAINPHAPGSPRQDFALACYNCVMGEGFGLTLEPASAEVCAPDAANTTVTVAAFGSFAGAVSLSALDLPLGLSAQFDPAVLDPAPGSSVLTLSDTDAAAPGAYAILIQGESDGETPRSAGFDLTIAADAPATPLPAVPANDATGVTTAPTLEWSAVAGATGYLVELASDPSFTSIVFSASTQATQVTVSPLLSTSTRYWWRVTASNACGEEASTAFRFTTESAPGDCPLGTQPNPVFAADFSEGLGDFTTTGSSGAQTWGMSTARPSPLSGGNAAFAANLASVSDQRLTSPAIDLPDGQLPLTLKFQNWREIEQNTSTSCYDGGILEIAVDGGSFALVPDALLLNDPYRGTVNSGYSNPIGSSRAWCDVPSKPWTDTLVDLSSFAGSTVQLRWRLGTDNIVSQEGWFVDDIRLQSCIQSTQADLAIGKSVDPEVAVIGTQATFTLIASNNGSIDATEVVVEDLLPSGYAFVSASASAGSYDEASGEWSIGELPDGQSETLEITVTVLGSGEHLNVASISAAEDDPDASNNSASAGVTAIEPPTADLSISKEVEPRGAGVGDAVSFVLTAGNAGPAAASGVVVSNLLPDGYAFAGAVASAGTYEAESGEWTIGAMAVDASETLTITAIILMQGDYDSAASITGNEPDPEPGNNSADASAEPVILLDIFGNDFE